MVYPYIPGSSSAAFQGVSLFAGALFTLGASSTAGNFIGGIVLIFSGSFRVGDRIKIGNVVGDVEESTLALTRLRTNKNELITFANGSVLAQSLVNYSAIARKDGVIIHTSVTIGYDVPWRKVHELLLAAAMRTEYVLEEPPPFVLQTSLNDFHVSYQINAYTREANRMTAILSELHEHIQDSFAEGGVEILSPSFTALRDAYPGAVLQDKGSPAE
jgi:small-conductance mechanosensitive channel